jgi:hypothetical protein
MASKFRINHPADAASCSKRSTAAPTTALAAATAHGEGIWHFNLITQWMWHPLPLCICTLHGTDLSNRACPTPTAAPPTQLPGRTCGALTSAKRVRRETSSPVPRLQCAGVGGGAGTATCGAGGPRYGGPGSPGPPCFGPRGSEEASGVACPVRQCRKAPAGRLQLPELDLVREI